MPDAGRVVAGSARSIRLDAPGEGTRPLGDRVKEALFATIEAGSLAPWPAPFLDLFAGSGAGGIEALSRGAPQATFVERDRRAVTVIAANLARARLAERATVVGNDALAFLDARDAYTGPLFGAALVDPPYGEATLVPALERLAESAAPWLATRAVVVAKHFWRDPMPTQVGDLSLARSRRFGETALTFYVRSGEPT
ncbi:MAG: 16S rRNA (guanine(966)-N(2))-methyltransferase RsmD [Candidatus Limnocylindrales bacterium]